jgi:hypothetical protein
LCRSEEALSNYLKRAYLSIQHVVDTIFSTETTQPSQSSKTETQEKKSNTAAANSGSSSRVDISAWLDASTNDDQRNETQKPAGLYFVSLISLFGSLHSLDLFLASEVVLPFEFPAVSSQLSSTETLALLQARLQGLVAVVRCVLTTPTKHMCRVDVVDWLALIERVLKLEISIAEIRSFSATKISALGSIYLLRVFLFHSIDIFCFCVVRRLDGVAADSVHDVDGFASAVEPFVRSFIAGGGSFGGETD